MVYHIALTYQTAVSTGATFFYVQADTAEQAIDRAKKAFAAEHKPAIYTVTDCDASVSGWKRIAHG